MHNNLSEQTIKDLTLSEKETIGLKDFAVFLAILGVTALAVGLISLGALIVGPMQYDDYGTGNDLYSDYEYDRYEGSELADTLSETMIWVWGFVAVLAAFLSIWGIAYLVQNRNRVKNPKKEIL